jgi:hypothetical protein
MEFRKWSGANATLASTIIERKRTAEQMSLWVKENIWNPGKLNNVSRKRVMGLTHAASGALHFFKMPACQNRIQKESNSGYQARQHSSSFRSPFGLRGVSAQGPTQQAACWTAATCDCACLYVLSETCYKGFLYLLPAAPSLDPSNNIWRLRPQRPILPRLSLLRLHTQGSELQN